MSQSIVSRSTLPTPAEAAAAHGWRRVLAFGAHPDDRSTLDADALPTVIAHRAFCGACGLDGPLDLVAHRHAQSRQVVRFDQTLAAKISLEDWRGQPLLSPDGRVVLRLPG